MPGRRAVQPFEPVLVEKRGERRLPERRLPQNAEERCFRLIGFALEERRHRSGFGRRPLARVRPRAEPEIDKAPSLRRRKHKMRDLVQDHISFGVGIERGAVPVKTGMCAGWVHRYAEMLGKLQRLPAVSLGYLAAGALARGCADSRKRGTRLGIIELGRKTAERRAKLLTRDRS